MKEVFQFPEGGNLPVHAHGSRWINHKCKALQRVLDQYGAYLHHLVTQDKFINSADRQRLKGYLFKWREARMLLGLAMYVDVLQPLAVLSLTLQDDNVDVVQAIKPILKSHSSLKNSHY